jgi:hypothetical protein
MAITQEAGRIPEKVWPGVEKKSIDSTGVRNTNRPARSQSLYLMGYPLENACEVRHADRPQARPKSNKHGDASKVSGCNP